MLILPSLQLGRGDGQGIRRRGAPAAQRAARGRHLSRRRRGRARPRGGAAALRVARGGRGSGRAPPDRRPHGRDVPRFDRPRDAARRVAEAQLARRPARARLRRPAHAARARRHPPEHGLRAAPHAARRAGRGAAGVTELRMPETRYDLVLPAGSAESRLERLEAITRALLEKNAQLERALETRIVIEQAKGVLAERLAVDVEEAFHVLRFAARSSQHKLHELAAAIVSSREMPPAVESWLARQAPG